MNIVVVGCGKIGRTIISSLVNENHDVLAIDENPEKIREVTNLYDVMGIVGSGTSYEKLKNAEVSKADLFIAVTNSDEINMLSCFAAKRMGAKNTVARIRDAENNSAISLEFMKNLLDISMAINPELMTANAIYNLLKLPSATKVETFSSHRFEMIELNLKDGSPLDGMTIVDLRKTSNEKFLICTVSRGNEVYIPQGNFKLKSGDKIGVIASRHNTQKILKTLGIVHKQVHDAMIMGAGKTSYYLAKMLLESHIAVKVVEKNNERCEEFCESFPNAQVICGNCMNQDLLIEEGINTTDAFVSLTGHDEENILISFYAMSQNNDKVVAKVNGEELSSIAEKLGLDSIVSPKMLIADSLVQYARALENSEGSKVETLYRLMNGRVEALEFNVLPDFEFIDVPVRDIHLRNDIIIAGIVRGTDTIIPSGADVIKAHDKVIVIAKGEKIYDLSSIIKH